MSTPIPDGLIETMEFATRLGVTTQSVRARLSTFGSYHGIKPRKRYDKRLLWPESAVQELLDRDLLAEEKK